MIYFDTETVGFESPIVLIQWAEDDGEIMLHNVWNTPIRETIELIEYFCHHEQGVCGFNLTFDWFHLCQTYTTLERLGEKVGFDKEPIDYVEEYAIEEAKASLGPCLKPQRAFDIMLHARKGPYQTTMDRKDIRIKRVPEALATPLCAELSQRIPLKDIYFERSSNKKKRWVVRDIFDENDRYVEGLKDLVLAFQPSSALKALAYDALDFQEDTILKFTDVEVSDKLRPNEVHFAPFAMAIGKPGKWNHAWPAVIRSHYSHWQFNKLARKYAANDVVYTRSLAYYFTLLDNGCQEDEAKKIVREFTDRGKTIIGIDSQVCSLGNDVDSRLACLVGAVRWRGYRIDCDEITALRNKVKDTLDRSPYNFNAPHIVRKYLEEVLEPEERMVMQVNGKLTTKRTVLEEIAKWRVEEVCSKCSGEGCELCSYEGLIKSEIPTEAAKRAQEVLSYRMASQRLGLYNKLLQTGRFHPSLKVIGTLSSRMSGGNDEQAKGGSINPQGIPHETEVRRCFKLADEGYILDGGDFKAFEVGLMDACYGDPDLRLDLKSGKKIHALFGQYLFPGYTYEEIKATDGLPGEKDLYGRSKNGVFCIAYGGEAHSLQNRVGISAEAAEEAYQKWISKYKVWGQERQKIFDMFCSMRQPGGIGTRVEWHDPADYIESMLGFRRYFTLENRIVKALFDLAEKPPKYMQDMDGRIVRRDREQTLSGAVRSALFAAAFAVQAANMRAAGNHVIQSTGAQLTKELEARLWEIQPAGVNPWQIIPMNIHDEIMAPMKEKHVGRAAYIVNSFIEEYKPIVPLIGMDWKSNLDSWAAKKS